MPMTEPVDVSPRPMPLVVMGIFVVPPLVFVVPPPIHLDGAAEDEPATR
ncbi:hypothetical protein GCM10027200_45910 [Lentzea nigeriaca]